MNKQNIKPIAILVLLGYMFLASCASKAKDSHYRSQIILPDVDVNVDFDVTPQSDVFEQGNYIKTISPNLTNVMSQLSQRLSTNPEIQQKKYHVQHSLALSYDFEVQFHKISYTITDVLSGTPLQVSGLLAIPELTKSFPLLVFAPGTRSGLSSETPSEASSSGEYALIASILAAATEFAVFVPDYVGWGDSENSPHHYLNANEAVQVLLNGASAAYDYSLESSTFSLNKDLIISGYSQGGINALFSTIYIERFPTHYPNLNLVASLPMGGSPNLRQHITSIYNNTSYEFPIFLPYILMSNNDTHTFYQHMDDVMDDTFSADIKDCIFNSNSTLMECNSLISSDAPLNLYDSNWLDIFFDNIVAGDISSPLSRFVFENSAYYLLNDWEPQDHLGYRFYHCLNDSYTFFQIDNDFVNYLINEKNANATMINPSDTSGHTTCILPSLVDAISWINSNYN